MYLAVFRGCSWVVAPSNNVISSPSLATLESVAVKKHRRSSTVGIGLHGNAGQPARRVFDSSASK